MSFDAELRDVLEPSPLPHRWPLPTGVPAAVYDPLPPSVARTGTQRPYVKAFACAGVTYLAATALLLAFLLSQVLPRATSHELGDVTAGALFFFSLACFVPAVVTGLLVSQSPRVCSVSQIALVFLPLFFLAVTLQVLGAVSG